VGGRIMTDFLDQGPGKNTFKEKMFSVDKGDYIDVPAFYKGGYGVRNVGVA